MQIQFAGYRLRSPGWDDDGRDNPPLLIELTAKRWKGLILIAYTLAIVSFILLGWQLWSGVYQPLLEIGLKPDTSPIAALGDALYGFGGIAGLSLLVAAVVLSIYARFMAWWRHG